MNCNNIKACLDWIVDDAKNMSDQIDDLDTGAIFRARLRRVRELLDMIDEDIRSR